ncbi:rhodanese-like domain-containing protein [Desulforhopalus sp. 52FAK]
MNWTSLFSKTEEISVASAKKFIEATPQASYQLVDVRQPKEYQEQHIPGALLIPLNELKERADELSEDLPTIVYCRSGVRSKAGCQILKENNFSQLHNLTGGILQWNGATAFGGEEFGLDFFLQNDYTSGLEMAYHLEKGLHQFYNLLSTNNHISDIKTLLTQMAQMEDGHMATLINQAKTAGLTIDTTLPEPSVLEGGLSALQLQAAFGDNLTSKEAVIQLAMMFEAQAWDLYSRLSRKSATSADKTFYLKMAKEEQKHLDKLSGELDNLL